MNFSTHVRHSAISHYIAKKRNTDPHFPANAKYKLLQPHIAVLHLVAFTTEKWLQYKKPQMNRKRQRAVTLQCYPQTQATFCLEERFASVPLVRSTA